MKKLTAMAVLLVTLLAPGVAHALSPQDGSALPTPTVSPSPLPSASEAPTVPVRVLPHRQELADTGIPTVAVVLTGLGLLVAGLIALWRGRLKL